MVVFAQLELERSVAHEKKLEIQDLEITVSS
jgi:hypothetical protein